MYYCHNCQEIFELRDGACRVCGEREELEPAVECPWCLEFFYEGETAGIDHTAGLCPKCIAECDGLYKAFLRSLPPPFAARIQGLEEW